MFKFVITTETLTPSHYPEFETTPARTCKRREYDHGMRMIIEDRESRKRSAVKPCGCTYLQYCEHCSYAP